MKETIVFLLKIFAKYGIWIFGLSWLLAIGSQINFFRTDNVLSKTKESILAHYKNRINVGVVILLVGIIIALIPIK